MELDFLEIFGTLVGLVYLWLEYRASIYLWIAGVVMPAIYIFVYYKAGLYADFGINIYYLIAAVYGWFFWMWGHRKKKCRPADPPTALSIVGMWMLARKYIEQWFAWIIVDIVCCGLYIYKDLYFTSALYGLYSIIAIFGYFKWKKLMNIQ